MGQRRRRWPTNEPALDRPVDPGGGIGMGTCRDGGGAVSGSLDCIPQTLPPVIQLVVFVRHKSPSSLKPTPQNANHTLKPTDTFTLVLFSTLLLFSAQANPTERLLAGLNTP